MSKPCDDDGVDLLEDCFVANWDALAAYGECDGWGGAESLRCWPSGTHKGDRGPRRCSSAGGRRSCRPRPTRNPDVLFSPPRSKACVPG